jgi:hypothetical protein
MTSAQLARQAQQCGVAWRGVAYNGSLPCDTVGADHWVRDSLYILPSHIDIHVRLRVAVDGPQPCKPLLHGRR